MKKIFTVFGILFAITLLSGCGQSGSDTEQQNITNSTTVETDDYKTVLPETVSTQPGETADDEIKNIDKDLQAINDESLNEGFSDSDLGL